MTSLQLLKNYWLYCCCLSVCVLIVAGQNDTFTCTTCEYDEGLSYSLNRTCLTDPGSVSLISNCTTKCYTAAAYYGNNLRVSRGCDIDLEFSWTNDCAYSQFGVVYGGYVCTCDTQDNCNSDDTGHFGCYQCDSREDDDCYANLNTNLPVACLTGHTKCIMETMEPYPETAAQYSGLDIYDYVRRYCADTDYGKEGIFIDFHLASLHCYHSCDTSACNDQQDVCITVKAITCQSCFYIDGRQASDSNCLTNPNAVSTIPCYNKCYTKGWHNSLGGQQISRGCDSAYNYEWTNTCRYVVDGVDLVYACTCDGDGNVDTCNADDTDYMWCYYCDSAEDDNCYDVENNLNLLLPSVTGSRYCTFETMAPYADKISTFGDNQLYNYMKRYSSDIYYGPDGICVDYNNVALRCYYSCHEEGCHQYEDYQCISSIDISEPIMCVSCDYNSAAYDYNRECLTDPSSMPTTECNSTCITRAYYLDGNLQMHRGCDCNNIYTDIKNECRYTEAEGKDDIYVCTCSGEDLCNSDDSHYHQCYQCDSRNDFSCYSQYYLDSPQPCVTGHRACVTEVMEPYDQLTYMAGVSSYDYVNRYCGNDDYGADGNCIDNIRISLRCYSSCDEEACNTVIPSTGSFIKTFELWSCIIFYFGFHALFYSMIVV